MTEQPKSLKRFEGLSDLFQRKLEPVLTELERERSAKEQQYQRMKRNRIAFFALLIPVMFYYEVGWFLAILLPLFIMGISIDMAYEDTLKKFEPQVKKLLMENICELLDLKYRRVPDGLVKIETFVDIGLISSDYNREHTEDEIAGSYEGVEFVMMEAGLAKTYRSKRHGSSIIFKGILAIYTFPKKFSGTTWVLADFLFNDVDKGERVKLEDPEFEKQFDVFSTDQVEARYILTPNFMERVKRLNRLVVDVSSIDMAFHENQLFLALYSGKNFFESGEMLTALNDRERVKRIAEEIHSLFTIPETLNVRK